MPDITVPPNPRREHCVARLSRIKMIGRNKDQQVRIERPTANGAALALYTVEGVHEHESDIVFVGYRNLEDLEKRLELSNTDPFTGKVKAQVTAEGLTDEQAEKRSEFIERLTDNGNNRGLVVIAPLTAAKLKNTLICKQNMLANSFHLSMFLNGFAKVLKNRMVPLTAGTLLRQILAKSRSRS
jgi:hypothetical protein